MDEDERAGGDGDERAGADGDAGERADEDGSARWGWVSWLPIAAAALCPLVLAEVARQVLGGARDEPYFGYADEAGQEVPVGRRVGLLWALVPVPQVLLAGTCALVVVCGVVLAGRPGWLVPGRVGRWVAAGVAAACALEGLAALGVLLQAAARPPDQAGDDGLLLTFLGLPAQGLVELGPQVAVLVPAVVVPALAAVLLVRPPAPAARVRPAPAAAGEGPAAAPAPAAQGSPAQTSPAAPLAQGSPAAPVGQGTPGPSVRAEIPRLPVDERAHYRRPVA
ncbi:hypothetical protein [Kineococcus sp. SYSU DK006]|uniref:hypothetical protein n=1 Tax=Kineococcus sp. SYSU DK006 TaxID=3383127 RepID=UPI003D7D843F